MRGVVVRKLVRSLRADELLRVVSVENEAVVKSVIGSRGRHFIWPIGTNEMNEQQRRGAAAKSSCYLFQTAKGPRGAKRVVVQLVSSASSS